MLHDRGFDIVATGGTARAIARMGIPVEPLKKIAEGSPNVVDWIESGRVDMVINTPSGRAARSDGYEIRRAAAAKGIACITTLTGGMAAARAIGRGAEPAVVSLQEIHAQPVEHMRTFAPLGRRLVDVTRRQPLGAYFILQCADEEGPRPQPGQFYMLAAAERWGAGEDERPFLPRAFSVARYVEEGCRLEFMLEDVGPGHAPPGRAARGRRTVDPRAARKAVRRVAGRPASRARRRRHRDGAARHPATTAGLTLR